MYDLREKGDQENFKRMKTQRACRLTDKDSRASIRFDYPHNTKPKDLFSSTSTPLVVDLKRMWIKSR